MCVRVCVRLVPLVISSQRQILKNSLVDYVSLWVSSRCRRAWAIGGVGLTPHEIHRLVGCSSAWGFAAAPIIVQATSHGRSSRASWLISCLAFLRTLTEKVRLFEGRRCFHHSGARTWNLPSAFAIPSPFPDVPEHVFSVRTRLYRMISVNS
jgi:hypothetical protein